MLEFPHIFFVMSSPPVSISRWGFYLEHDASSLLDQYPLCLWVITRPNDIISSSYLIVVFTNEHSSDVHNVVCFALGGGRVWNNRTLSQ